MSEITITISRMDLRRIGTDMQRRMDDVVNESANAIIADAKLSIANPPKTGRTYTRGKTTHQASAPGEPPAWDLGNLAGDSEVRKMSDADYEVVFSAKYAPALEFGYAPRNLAARPFLRPAVEREHDTFETNMGKALRSAR